MRVKRGAAPQAHSYSLYLYLLTYFRPLLAHHHIPPRSLQRTTVSRRLSLCCSYKRIKLQYTFCSSLHGEPPLYKQPMSRLYTSLHPMMNRRLPPVGLTTMTSPFLVRPPDILSPTPLLTFPPPSPGTHICTELRPLQPFSSPSVPCE